MSAARDDLGWMDRAMCVAAGVTRWESWPALERFRVCHGCPVRVECREWMNHDQRTTATAATPPAEPVSAGVAQR